MAYILILEDDPNFLQILQESLEDHPGIGENQEPLRFEACNNPKSALDWARWNDFDLMLTDVRMAGERDGIGTLTEIKRIRPNVYSIILTGYVDDLATARAIQAGADHFLYKDKINLEKLFNTIEQALDSQREHLTYQSMLVNILKSSQRYISRLGRPDEPEADKTILDIDRTRINLYKSYYTAIQSSNLTVSAARSVWDSLLSLDLQYNELPPGINEATKSLNSQYLSLTQSVMDLCTKRQVCKPATQGIPNDQFLNFYTQIQTTAVSPPSILGAPLLWNHYSAKPPDIRTQHGRLFKLLFLTKPKPANDPNKGAQMSFKELIRIIEAGAKA